MLNRRFDSLSRDELCAAGNYQTTHQLAIAVREIAEALLIPSCTKFPEGDLVIFPDRRRAGSTIDVDYTVDPDLYTPQERFR